MILNDKFLYNNHLDKLEELGKIVTHKLPTLKQLSKDSGLTYVSSFYWDEKYLELEYNPFTDEWKIVTSQTFIEQNEQEWSVSN